MTDGAYEGYRAELEGTARAKRMDKYGSELCFTCEKVLEKDGSPTTMDFDRNSFLQAELIIERGRPIPMPEKVTFCSEMCKARHQGAMHIVSRMVDLLTEPSSPAFRTNFRKHMEKVLRTTEMPNV